MPAQTGQTLRPFRVARSKARRRTTRPMIETLEERVALTLGSEFQVAASNSGGAYGSANASSSNGTAIIAYIEPTEFLGGQPSGVDIFAQRYSAAKIATGGRIDVGTFDVTNGNGVSGLAVAMDANGNAVVVWTSSGPSRASSIIAARITNTGQAIDPQITVAFYKGNSSEPSVAMDRNGNFVVSWTYQYGAYNQNQVWATRFTANGTSLGNIAVATSTSFNDRESHVAMTPDGRFDVVYQLTTTSNYSYIFENSYSATGQLSGLSVVDSGLAGSTEYYPVVAMDNAGDAVISWYELKNNNRNIMVRQLSHTGSLGALTALTNNTVQDLAPQVAMNPTTGSFVVAFRLTFTLNSTEIFEMNANGTFRTAYNTGNNRIVSSLSIDGKGYYLLSYTNFTNPTSVWARFGWLG